MKTAFIILGIIALILIYIIFNYFIAMLIISLKAIIVLITVAGIAYLWGRFVKSKKS